MTDSRSTAPWPLGQPPSLSTVLPETMSALTLRRDDYGPPNQVIRCEEVPVPRLTPADAGSVLVSILASGPNFNTNFAALGLPVPVFGRGDSATVHIPGSDALGLVVDAGPAVRGLTVGQAVILDSWTGGTIRGYETHDGFNAQFALVDEKRAIPVPPELNSCSPERLAAMLLTYGTAYRAVVERLAVGPGETILVMGGGKGTSFAGAQIAKSLGAKVILVGSNPELAESLIGRGIADRFVDRRAIPRECFGVLTEAEDAGSWSTRTQPFREAVLAVNDGRPVDCVFEHTGGANFPLLVSVLGPGGRLAFFGATGRGLKGEYKETFFYDGERMVMDARWVWMRQKQVLFSSRSARQIFSAIGLLPGRRGLVWGTDEYAQEFVVAALERDSEIAVIASRSLEAAGIGKLAALGIDDSRIIDRDGLVLPNDMPDPLTEEGTPNPEYAAGFMDHARALGRAVWGVFGPRTSPDFVVERPDQSTLHFSSFVLRDHDEGDEMSCGWIVARGQRDLAIHGSHMYRDGQAREVVRLLAENRIEMAQEDLEVVGLRDLPEIQQRMLDGTMTRPKGVALVQADRQGRSLADFESDFLGQSLMVADPAANRLLEVRELDGVAILSICRPSALNALNDSLVGQLAAVVDELASSGSLAGVPVSALVIRGSGRAFVAGADVGGFVGRTPQEIEDLANSNMAVFTRLEHLEIPVVSLIDGFALGGGCELAMSTHYRILTERAVVGQPEIKLGIIPGYGGMQRLPRLVGPRLAAEMSLNGESIDGGEAVRIGLAHEVQPSATALVRAFAVARALRSGEMQARRPEWDAVADGQREALASLVADAEVRALLTAPSVAEDTAGDLVAARRYAGRVALEALIAGYAEGFEAGLANDARLFGQVAASPSGQTWVGRFLAKDPTQQSFLTLLSPGR